MAWVDIGYGDFYDIPHFVVVGRGDAYYMFDGPFDDDLDEYPDDYEVYRIDRSSLAFAGPIDRLPYEVPFDDLMAAAAHVGQIPKAAMRFDETRRRQIDDAVLDLL